MDAHAHMHVQRERESSGEVFTRKSRTRTWRNLLSRLRRLTEADKV